MRFCSRRRDARCSRVSFVPLMCVRLGEVDLQVGVRRGPVAAPAPGSEPEGGEAALSELPLDTAGNMGCADDMAAGE